MTPRDPHDPQPRDRSLFQVLVGLIDASRANTDAVSRMGTQADEWASRCEAIERVCSECQRERDEHRKREEAVRVSRGRTWTALGRLYDSRPVQLLLMAAVLIGVSCLSRCADVPTPTVGGVTLAPATETEVSDVP